MNEGVLGRPAPRRTGLSSADLDDPAAVARHEARLMKRALADMGTADLRRHMRSRVRRMSTLVTAALAAAGVDLDTMLWGMRAGGEWSTRALVGTWERQSIMHHGKMDGHGRQHDFVRRWGSFEMPVIGLAAEEVAAEVVGRRIEFLMQGAGWILTTFQGRGKLTFDETLPDTVVASARDQRLDRFVEHPLLTGCGFVIDRIETTAASTSIEFAVTEELVSPPDFGKRR